MLLEYKDVYKTEAGRYVNAMIKYILIVFIFFSSYCHAQNDRVEIYLAFEKDFMSNEYSRISGWLAEDYSLTSVLNTPDLKGTEKTVSRAKLLERVKGAYGPSTLPPSIPSNIVIEAKSESEFCGRSGLTMTFKVSGKTYEQIDLRKVCFRLSNSKYLVEYHYLETFYNEK